jgi:DNA-directed RNA polymerase specialized sigma subunit
MILDDLKRADLQVQNTKASYEAACRERKALILEALRDVSASDVARSLGVTRARVSQLRK